MHACQVYRRHDHEGTLHHRRLYHDNCCPAQPFKPYPLLLPPARRPLIPNSFPPSSFTSFPSLPPHPSILCPPLCPPYQALLHPPLSPPPSLLPPPLPPTPHRTLPPPPLPLFPLPNSLLLQLLLLLFFGLLPRSLLLALLFNQAQARKIALRLIGLALGVQFLVAFFSLLRLQGFALAAGELRCGFWFGGGGGG